MVTHTATTLRVPPPVISKLPVVQEHLHGHHQGELHHLLHSLVHSPHAYGVARTNSARLTALQRGASRYSGVAGPLCAVVVHSPVPEYTCIHTGGRVDLSTTSRSRTSSTTAKEQVSNAARGSLKRTARTRRHNGSLNPSAAAAGPVLDHLLSPRVRRRHVTRQAESGVWKAASCGYTGRTMSPTTLPYLGDIAGSKARGKALY